MRFFKGMITGLALAISVSALAFIGGGTAQHTHTTASSGGVLPSGDVQTFDSSGTWTKPIAFADTRLVLIEAWGGGGSGGSGASATVAGGGGGGGYKSRLMRLVDLGSTETVTIGTGGARVTNVSGLNGGNTTFGSHVTAYGGNGGPKPGTNIPQKGGAGGGFHTSPSVSISNDTGEGWGTTDATTVVLGLDATFAGGGGGGSQGYANSSLSRGGNSLYGGGGGGATGNGGGAGGKSIYGGNGGAGGVGSGCNAGACDGQVPGGGGGANRDGQSGAGASGRVRVTVF